MNNFQRDAANFFHSLVQRERHEFFGVDDGVKWLPEFQSMDAMCMCPPFMGNNYKKGGLIIIPINPGGGNETSERRNPGDSLLYPSIHEFKSQRTAVEDFYWEHFVSNFKKAMKTYPIYQKMLPILEAAKSNLDDICYFNFLPYRGRGNRYPTSKRDMRHIIPNCIEKFVEPNLNFLDPSLVVAFGKQVDIYVDEFWRDFRHARISWNRDRAPKPSVLNDREQSKNLLQDWSKNR